MANPYQMGLQLGARAYLRGLRPPSPAVGGIRGTRNTTGFLPGTTPLRSLGKIAQIGGPPTRGRGLMGGMAQYRTRPNRGEQPYPTTQARLTPDTIRRMLYEY